MDIRPTDRPRAHDARGLGSRLVRDFGRCRLTLRSAVLALCSAPARAAGGLAARVSALVGAAGRVSGGRVAAPVERDGSMEDVGRELDLLRSSLRDAIQSLAIEKSRYQALVTSLSGGVFTTDMDGRVTSANTAALSLLESECGPAQGFPCHAQYRLVEALRNPACRLLCMGIAADRPVAAAAVRITKEPGRELDVEFSVSPIHDEEGRAVGLVHIARDVAAGEELQRRKKVFLMTVAHELRTPLTSLSAFVDLLRQDIDTISPKERDQMLSAMKRGALRLQHLVSNLLDLGSIEAGRFAMNPQSMDLRFILEEAVAMCEPFLAPKGQRVAFAKPLDVPRVYADGRRISQVLMNLLTNCAKYGPDGDTIEIAACREGDRVRVSVSDHGTELPPEQAEQVFEYFYQAEHPQALKSQGLGLGLSIAKGIIDAHGGRIGVESEPGKGTTVWFTLPVLAGTVPAIQTDP